ncbi:MAG: hypothetical protein ACRDF0_01700, partial [Candidatus Limnocylindria bacterium]
MIVAMPLRATTWAVLMLTGFLAVSTSSFSVGDRKLAFAVQALAAPRETVSQYIHLYDQAQLENLGCSEATDYPGGVVVLHFGQQWSSGGVRGVYGYDNQFHSTGAIAGLMESFSRGYYNCTTASVQIAMGTSNDGSWHDSTAGSTWGSWIQ